MSNKGMEMEQDENYYTDYAKGINDCLVGVPSKSGQSDRYNQGYSDQYALEQVISGGGK